VYAGIDGQPGGGGSNPERSSSLLTGTFTTAALNALSISEDALPPPEQLMALLEASGGEPVVTATAFAVLAERLGAAQGSLVFTAAFKFGKRVRQSGHRITVMLCCSVLWQR
jgi:hypothetical protein